MFAFLIGVYYLTNKPKEQPIYSEAAEITEQDHIKWSKNNEIILTEYSDIQCPACSSAHSSLKQLEEDEEISKYVTFVYRHFPLQSIHPHAFDAALAAEAAAKQDKFFEMLDILFAKQTEWSKAEKPKEQFVAYAKEIGLNTEQFTVDMDSQEVKDKVTQDLTSANRGGLSRTPTFFLNGKRLSFRTFDELKKELQKEIDQIQAER